jgi:glycosyltransferase involved in cell wall biosynthesis
MAADRRRILGLKLELARWINRKLSAIPGTSLIQGPLQRRIELSSEEASSVRLLRPAFGLAENSRRLNRQFLAAGKQASALNWFIPNHENSLYAGVYTILRFASRLASFYSIPTRIVIYDQTEGEISRLRERIEFLFPALRGAVSCTALDGGVSIATFWKSAYVVAERRGEANYYFIQDYEPAFYQAGSLYGLVENSYRLGLMPIVNTPGLWDFIHRIHNVSDGVSFIPTIDRALFRPATDGPPVKDPIQIVFYGRPSQHRNGFDLGTQALTEVKQAFGARVNIVSAGADWNPREFGLQDVLENRGRLSSLSEVAALYRGSHIGLCLMFTKHPSYQPFEMIASGCVVVTNENESTSWFFRNEENCLLSPPTVPELSSALTRLISDYDLWGRIRSSAVNSLSKQSWDEVIDETCLKAGLISKLS